jgi:hypothetical protein
MKTGMKFPGRSGQLDQLDLTDLLDLLEQVQKLRQYLPQATPKELRVPVSDPENAPG